MDRIRRICKISRRAPERAARHTLIRWLIKSLVKRPLYWMKDPIEGPTCAEEALNTLLFRAATGLGFSQKDIILGQPEFRQARSQYDANPAEFLKLGHQRFELLVASIPPDCRARLIQNGSLDTSEKGPPS